MKLKKSDINIIIMLVGVLLGFGSYLFVFNGYKEKTAALEAENATLETEVAGLQELADNKEFYIAETARMNDEMQTIMDQFPSEVRVEDQIMYAAGLENQYSIWVNDFSAPGMQMVQVAAPAAAAPAPEGDAVEADLEGEAPAEGAAEGDAAGGDAVVASAGMQETVFLYNSPFNLGFKTTYRSIKDIVDAIIRSDERMDLVALTLAYDGTTGCLSGTLDSNMYTMSGTDKEYEPVNISGVTLGTADFFQSATVLDLTTNAGAVPENNAEGDQNNAEGGQQENGGNQN